ncbi:MAG: hypothetical protein K2Q12_03870 [Rickettsiales bacterium]|nr:hypothetical protein [Rickettsiales bacterium]
MLERNVFDTVKPFYNSLWTSPFYQKLVVWLQPVRNLFSSHPAETGETYAQHLIFTIKMGVRILTCGVLLLVHGALPFTFRRTVSAQIKKIYRILDARVASMSDSDKGNHWDI